MSKEPEPVVILSTVATKEDAAKLARLLIEKQLAACVNIVPGLTSIYRWEGKVVEETELLLVIKTLKSNTESIERAFAEAHPYKLPELIELPLSGGKAAYLDWIAEGSRGR